MSDEYEYGIAISIYGPEDPHRSGMDLEEAEDWIRTLSDPNFDNFFYIIRRPLGPWERYPRQTTQNGSTEG